MLAAHSRGCKASKLQPLIRIVYFHSSIATLKYSYHNSNTRRRTPIPEQASVDDSVKVLPKDEAVQLASGVLGMVEDYLKRVKMSESQIIPELSAHVKVNLRDDLDQIYKLFTANDVESMEKGLRKISHVAKSRIVTVEGQRRLRGDQFQAKYKAAYYRGGTSRAIIFNSTDLPRRGVFRGRDIRKELFQQAIGSPDPHGRQLNGMGAGVSSLSKICIVAGPSSTKTEEYTYTFVGMGIEGDEVDYTGNCGNMAAAIGPYVFNERIKKETLADAECDKDQPWSVLIRNTNTGVLIRSTFEVKNGQALVDDTTSIDGVSGLGTRVLLDFIKPGGSKTGRLLPTGNAVDTIDGIQVSCVDSANPCIFVRASDLDIDPTILPAQFLQDTEKLLKLEKLRTAGTILMGLCKPGETPPRVIPKIAIVSPPVDQTVLSGEVNPGDSLDVVIRFISDGQPHRAIPLTGALCAATAAKIPGSVVNRCTRQTPVKADVITIGHPSGRIEVNATMNEDGEVECASVVRTARRIMDGFVYVTLPKLEASKGGISYEEDESEESEEGAENEGLEENEVEGEEESSTVLATDSQQGTRASNPADEIFGTLNKGSSI
ncbi:DUF453-domain-containing protein [Tothia fuscella]|uniref:DUF453-domain-containing protein n=1 Tax=Tothia fuscella TaxID=1048955 RepID=A0A9P4NZH6_9PEZI|nr:DUF453-domain-containing protein [Tothia fuscella]